MKKIIRTWLIVLGLLVAVSLSMPLTGQAETFDPPDSNFTPPTFNPDDENTTGNIIEDGQVAEDLNGDLKKNLENWQDDLEVGDPLKSIFRGFGWWVIIQGGEVVNGITGASKNTFDLLNIYGSEDNPGPLQKTIDDYMPIFVAVGTLVFVLMTLGIVFSKNQEVVGLLKSLLLSASIVVLLPFCFGQFSTLTTNTGKYVATQSNTGYAVIDKNVRDLYAIDENYDWIKPSTETVDETAKKQNYLEKVNKKNLQRMDVNGVVDPSKLGKVGSKIANNMLVVNEKGKVGVVSLNDGVGKSWWQSLLTGDAYYYRYHINFFTIIFYELLVLIVSAFLLYKLIKIEFEIVTNTGILQATAMTDTRGKRNWELVTKISSGFSAMIMVIFLQVLFSDGYAVTSTLPGGVFVQFIAGIALAFAVIEGPNVFQSLFGVSAGLDTGLKDLMTLSQGSMLAKNLVSGGKAIGGGLMNGGAYGVGGIVGMATGAFSNGENTDHLGGSSDNMHSEMDAEEEESTQNQSSQMENEEQVNAQPSDGENAGAQTRESENNGTNRPLDDTDSNLASGTSEMDGNDSSQDTEQGAYQSFNETPNGQSFGGISSNGSKMGDTASEQMGQSESSPNHEDASTSSKMGQSEPKAKQGSPARPITLSGAAENIAKGFVNNKVNSPKPNLIQRYHSAYQSSKMLSQGAINSLSNQANKKGKTDA
ncbi:pLS20_p028 family conjugation system transmembrane protein [Lactococcus allomyrinae]|uniref:DUF8208 domain-containing protein n=1 Tax=Lactococcus allomyrinae TaxID=2419773 RepID=A0A387BIJ2_9LACT|nr:hypothetical protein [Lactococcus allomyrinae]AYG02042.1 hypothetical protein D7I46_12960 [Lactococcus allomyrinae]